MLISNYPVWWNYTYSSISASFHSAHFLIVHIYKFFWSSNSFWGREVGIWDGGGQKKFLGKAFSPIFFWLFKYKFSNSEVFWDPKQHLYNFRGRLGQNIWGPWPPWPPSNYLPVLRSLGEPILCNLLKLFRLLHVWLVCQEYCPLDESSCMYWSNGHHAREFFSHVLTNAHNMACSAHERNFLSCILLIAGQQPTVSV